MVKSGLDFTQALVTTQARRVHVYKIWGLCLASVFVIGGVLLLFQGVTSPGGVLQLFGLRLSTESAGVIVSSLGIGTLFFVFRAVPVQIEFISEPQLLGGTDAQSPLEKVSVEYRAANDSDSVQDKAIS